MWTRLTPVGKNSTLNELLNAAFFPQLYKAAATIDLVPAWLRFLETRELIQAGTRRSTLNRLRGIDTRVLNVVEKFSSDEVLVNELDRWREKVEYEPGEIG